MSKEVRQFLLNSLAWFARGLALLVSGPFLYFLVFRSSQVIPNLAWRAPNQMPLLLTWLVVMAGIVATWRWEMAGGAITAGAAVAMVVFAYLGCGAEELPTCAVVAGPYMLSGLILMGSYWGKERLRSSEPPGRLAA